MDIAVVSGADDSVQCLVKTRQAHVDIMNRYALTLHHDLGYHEGVIDVPRRGVEQLKPDQDGSWTDIMSECQDHAARCAVMLLMLHCYRGGLDVAATESAHLKIDAARYSVDVWSRGGWQKKESDERRSTKKDQVYLHERAMIGGA